MSIDRERKALDAVGGAAECADGAADGATDGVEPKTRCKTWRKRDIAVMVDSAQLGAKNVQGKIFLDRD